MCVQHPRQQPQSNVCSTYRRSPLQSWLMRSISAPANKNHCAFHPSAITIAISACAFQSVHSTHWQFTVAIMCPTVQDLSKRTTASTLLESHQCNQCLCVLHPHQKPQSKACSTLWFLFQHQWTRIIVNSTQEPLFMPFSHFITVNHAIAFSACVSCIRISNHSPWCVPLAGHHQWNQCLIHVSSNCALTHFTGPLIDQDILSLSSSSSASSFPSLRHMAQRLGAPMQCALIVVSYLVIFPTLRSQLFSLIHPLKLVQPQRLSRTRASSILHEVSD